MNELCRIYADIKGKIDRRLEIFRDIGKNGTDEEVFTELVFCLMTPQTKARQAEKAIRVLSEKDYILNGTPAQLAKVLNIVRFRNNKAKYIVRARSTCGDGKNIIIRSILDRYTDVFEKRRWLSENVKGMGMKEASHFLRNIGYGADLAILDRHVLRNLKEHGFIKNDQVSLSGGRYTGLENVMRKFSEKLKIPLGHLDFVLWYKETNDIFK